MKVRIDYYYRWAQRTLCVSIWPCLQRAVILIMNEIRSARAVWVKLIRFEDYNWN